MDLLMNDEERIAKSIEKQEKQKQKLRKKERKKREKQQKEKQIEEIKAALGAFIRITNRLKSTDDISLRCYLLLDKLVLATDIGVALLTTPDYYTDMSDEISDSLGRLQIEIKIIMDWLMSEKKINAAETTNPLPDSDNISERRRR
jgi:hypothetical protein